MIIIRHIPVPNNLIQQNRFLPAEQVNIIT